MGPHAQPPPPPPPSESPWQGLSIVIMNKRTRCEKVVEGRRQQIITTLEHNNTGLSRIDLKDL